MHEIVLKTMKSFFICGECLDVLSYFNHKREGFKCVYCSGPVCPTKYVTK